MKLMKITKKMIKIIKFNKNNTIIKMKMNIYKN